MTTKQSISPPEAFPRLLRKALDASGLSLRAAAVKSGISPGYLSMLLNGERGVPADDTISKLEQVLDIPRGALFDTAGKHDRVAAKFVQKNGARLLMRTLAPLTEAEMAEVQTVAQRFANRHAKGAK
jgi:transcriptional regulator with XRE-family HTH domain